MTTNRVPTHIGDADASASASASTTKPAEVSTLDRLHATLLARKQADPDTSYVARLYDRGIDAILKKVGEEATETILAAKGDDRQNIVYETADLWFHTLIMLAHHDISPAEILTELERRTGVSGLDEKATRAGGKQISARSSAAAE